METIDRLFGRLHCIMEAAETSMPGGNAQHYVPLISKELDMYMAYPMQIHEKVWGKLLKEYKPLDPKTFSKYEEAHDRVFAQIMEYPEEERNKPVGDFAMFGFCAQDKEFRTK